MEKFNEVLLVDCSHILNQKQNINPKIIQMKLEIEKIFSKPSKKTHNFMDLLQSLDNSFNKKRAHRKTEQVKIQKKLAILSQELKKFNEKPLMINFKAIVRENMKENSNSKQNFQNFSFAKEKTEEKERQINSKKWQNQLKLLSSGNFSNCFIIFRLYFNFRFPRSKRHQLSFLRKYQRRLQKFRSC